MMKLPNFQSGSEFAAELDKKDELKHLREHFIFPQWQHRDVIYFTGNSLGLQPKSFANELQREANDWATLGVEGHFHAKHPWFSYHEKFADAMSKVVGAKSDEVVVMNQLTVNLHLMMMSFYRPSAERRKILFEHKPFPSDRYAFFSQAQLHGLDPNDVLVEMDTQHPHGLVDEDTLIARIQELGDELALVCIGGVNYYTGQLFDMKRITAAAHAVGAMCGFDLAHAAGNVPLHLHDWEVDFACWCTYKYLNSGPGAAGGVYVHERHAQRKDLFRLAGWWGHDKSSRFQMGNEFIPIPTAESWALSNAPVFNMIGLAESLNIFSLTTMDKLRMKSECLTAYLWFLVEEVANESSTKIEFITPRDPGRRGCQLSLAIEGTDKNFVQKMMNEGVVMDWRSPGVVRMAPVPMYNSFTDVYLAASALKKILS
jgi:kynureninase